MNFTTLSFICNVPAVQPLLPQVIFVAASMIRLGEWNDVCADLPNNVYVKRMPSSWNTAQQHLVILRLLKMILEPLMGEYQPIVFFDAAPVHLHIEILELMRELGLWYVVIPARLTWLLQPCDTHMFIRFKRFLKVHFQMEFGEYDGRRSVVYMIQLVVRAIRHIIQGYDWSSSFENNGLTNQPERVSSFIKNQIETRDLPPLEGHDPPTLGDLRLCWPRNRPMPEAAVMASFMDDDGYVGDSEAE